MHAAHQPTSPALQLSLRARIETDLFDAELFRRFGSRSLGDPYLIE